ncbi:hypothetical protein FKP32DRAFT_1187720 [Trametes sanguinea]|nr:hypothetical protein FKP32DRAFT_1187720 [Trametes sanguinea]
MPVGPLYSLASFLHCVHHGGCGCRSLRPGGASMWLARMQLFFSSAVIGYASDSDTVCGPLRITVIACQVAERAGGQGSPIADARRASSNCATSQ